ncbi:hypothetical protein FNV43_RR20783 [Rhamnella rubrinervis]|uniref:Sulfotransferase n=1 Tax=Rhamnella rubrinervis TaxID=2594499 RepID=A0A8K0GQT1_9ROSA|nr:hypothetical protein FNV43_RR20783 [Rhamnella rubrinervis]
MSKEDLEDEGATSFQKTYEKYRRDIIPALPSHNLPENKEETNEEDEAYQKTYEKYRDILPTLPKEKGWLTEYLFQYQGFWLSPGAVKATMLVQHYFRAQPTDIFAATPPKSGTTWLRALIFATMNRTQFELSTHPLLTTNPHGCFPYLETFICEDGSISNLDTFPCPRLFSTHIPYSLLPAESMTGVSGCTFVYLCRNPKDVLVSKWIFININKSRHKQLPALSLEEAFELFCQGTSHYGSFWEHVLGYWKASLENPKKILFLKYEDLKNEPLVYVKRLAEFLGKPFTPEEERNGDVEEIVRLCSFENLSSLEINKHGEHRFNSEYVVNNRDFFRKGQVGDWKNYLTDEMVKRIDQITEEKLYGSGLRFGA